jgi:hypothetical protein
MIPVIVGFLSGSFVSLDFLSFVSKNRLPRDGLVVKLRPPGTDHRISAVSEHLDSATECGFDPGVSLEAHL